MRDEPERRQVRRPDLVPVREQPLQVGRHAEHRRRPLALDRLRDQGRVERAGDDDPAAGQRRAHREPQRRRVVERRRAPGSRRCRRSPRATRSSATSAAASASDSSPLHTPFGVPGGAARAVHRPGARQPAVVGVGRRAARPASLGRSTTQVGERPARIRSRSYVVSRGSSGIGYDARREQPDDHVEVRPATAARAARPGRLRVVRCASGNSRELAGSTGHVRV